MEFVLIILELYLLVIKTYSLYFYHLLSEHVRIPSLQNGER